MRRRAFQFIVFALVLSTSTRARGQDETPFTPIGIQLPEVPRSDAPVQRLPIDEPREFVEPKLIVPISPNTGMLKIESDAEARVFSLAELAQLGNDYIDPRYVINSMRPDDLGIWERTRSGYGEQFHRLCQDTKQFYWSKNLLYLGLAVAVAAPIANTQLDQRIQDGYQRQAAVGMNRGVDEMATTFKYFGEYKYAIPAFLACSLSGHLFPDHVRLTSVGQFGDRSLRALAIGAPTVGVLQYGLGAGRPPTGDHEWHPFRHHNSASGHAFVGAVPFLTAASMVEHRAAKVLLVAASFGTGWSRIHHDAHYFSQVLLGWSVAYLAVEAVNHTESEVKLRVIPIDVPKGVGMGVLIQY